MGYNSYNRDYGRRRTRSSSGGGSRWMDLRYGGICKICGCELPAGSRAFWDTAAKAVTCNSLDCAEKDSLTITEALTGPWDKRTDTRVLIPARLGKPAPVTHSLTVKRVHTIRTNTGAVLSVNANGRCEDAPCCGCCS